MKTLIVEDDMSCSLLLNKILAPYGTCVSAMTGKEAVEKFQEAHNDQKPFDLICLDIMLPEMDGQEVLKAIRAWEAANHKLGSDGVRIIMTTALGDSVNVMKAFGSQCEAYVVKPIDKNKLLNEIRLLGLL